MSWDRTAAVFSEFQKSCTLVSNVETSSSCFFLAAQGLAPPVRLRFGMGVALEEEAEAIIVKVRDVGYLISIVLVERMSPTFPQHEGCPSVQRWPTFFSSICVQLERVVLCAYLHRVDLSPKGRILGHAPTPINLPLSLLTIIYLLIVKSPPLKICCSV